jgi:hypothetical protein
MERKELLLSYKDAKFGQTIETIVDWVGSTPSSLIEVPHVDAPVSSDMYVA